MKKNLNRDEYIDRLSDYAGENLLNRRASGYRPARSASWHERRRRELQEYGEWLQKKNAEDKK